jgi:hypothetical protein
LADEGAAGRAAGLTSSRFLGATFDFDAAGFAAGAVLRAADFPAVLLVVLVAI